ncbi:MAG: HEAT repeat domain-containing protein [Myxococcota bacterium]
MKLFVAFIASSLLLCLSYFALVPLGPQIEVRPMRPVFEARPNLGCRFRPGDTRAYEVRSSVRAWGLDGEATGEVDRFSAILSLRVETAKDDRSTLRAALTEVVLHQQLSLPDQHVTHPVTESFEFDVVEDCRIVAWRFPSRWSDPARLLVAGVLLAHEYVVQEGELWTSIQTDGIGEHRARYRWDGDTLVRRKLSYTVDGMEPFGMKLSLPYAEARATFGDDGLLTSKGRQRLQIRVGDEVRADLEERFSLRRIDTRYRFPADDAGLAATDLFQLDGSPSRLPEGPEGLDEARARYLGFVTGLADLKVADARTMAGLMAAHPSLVEDLVMRLNDPGMSEAERASVFWVLELAGTEQARTHLAELLDAPLPNDQIRAAVALSMAGEPTIDSGRELIALHERAVEPDVAGAALMAVGALGAQGDPDVKAFAREVIEAALDRATPGRETLAALDAVGNLGDAGLLEPLAERLDHRDPRVRGRAAEAMRALGPEAVGPLRRALEAEVNEEAALSMARTLRRLGPPQDGSIGWAQAQLASAPSAAVRAQLIQWLGASQSAEARWVLAEHFHVEGSSQLKRLIGRYVPASALRR